MSGGGLGTIREEWWSRPLRRARGSPSRGATTSQNRLRDRTPSSLPATEAPIATPPSRRAASSGTVFDGSGGFGGGNWRSSSPPTSRSGRNSPGCALAESNHGRPPAVHPSTEHVGRHFWPSQCRNPPTPSSSSATLTTVRASSQTTTALSSLCSDVFCTAP
ncbi:hypothetical protein AAHE18_20G098000 [Arachis hypogaea]